jgi:hypothetical protein
LSFFFILSSVIVRGDCQQNNFVFTRKIVGEHRSISRDFKARVVDQEPPLPLTIESKIKSETFEPANQSLDSLDVDTDITYTRRNVFRQAVPRLVGSMISSLRVALRKTSKTSKASTDKR